MKKFLKYGLIVIGAVIVLLSGSIEHLLIEGNLSNLRAFFSAISSVSRISLRT